jgi:hypothetical protein
MGEDRLVDVGRLVSEVDELHTSLEGWYREETAVVFALLRLVLEHVGDPVEEYR